MKIILGPELSLPLNFLSLRRVVFGGSGSGKTAFGRVLYEEATAAGVLCGAVDLKGDWWGLKATADGRADGIAVVIFGGEHQDVPLDEAGGASLADIVVDLRQPFIVDLENLSKGKQLRFLGQFFERLYDRNREPLVLFCDEADRYAPQKPMSPEANVCLGAVEDVAKRGRKHGIFATFITQRNASLNKGVSELCDVAVVFRTPGPRDQEAVEDWFSTKATRAQRDVVMQDLAGMPTGTAVVCSAHPDVKLFTTVPIRAPRTFDSSATPEIGKRQIVPKRLAQPDLDALRTRMAATIEKAKATDPRALQAEVVRLKRELAAAQKMVPTPATVETRTREVKVAVLKDGQIDRLERLYAKVEATAVLFMEAAGKLRAGAVDIRAAVGEVKTLTAPRGPESPFAGPRPPRPSAEVQATRPPRYVRAAVSTNGITGPEQRILDALAWCESLGITEPEQPAAAFLAGYTYGAGAWNNPRGSLRSKGLVEYRGVRLALTDGGRALAHVSEAALTTEELHRRVLGRLPGPEQRLLRVLLDAYPQPLDCEEHARRAKYEPGCGAYNNPRGRLRSLGLVEYPSPGTVVARSLLFLE